MQKRVRKNSDYICPKKPKLDISVNIDQERTDTNTMPSQFGHSKEIDTKSESFVLSTISSVECSDFSDVNITENSPVGNSIIKTFIKSETLHDSDTAEFKEVLQKIMKTEEAEDRVQCPPPDVTSGSPNNNLCSGSMHLQDNSEVLQESTLMAKQENETMESLSNFKLLHRENDILIDFDTNTPIEGTNNHGIVDGNNSICISSDNDLFLTEANNTKDSLSVKKSVESVQLNTNTTEDTNAPKCNNPPNMIGGNNNLTICNATPLEVNAVQNAEKKKLLPEQTAKVSIGNTTISVPLLKPVNFRRILTKEGKSVSNIVRKVINIRGKKIKAPTIVQLSQVQLNPKTNTKIVQATLVGNKIQLPNIGFKSSSGFVKSSFVQNSQCSPMAVTSLPKQIFEDEMVFVEKTTQPPSQPAEEFDLKSIESPTISNINNKSLAKPKEDLVPKSSPSYLTQFCVIETESTNTTRSFESIVTDALPSSITVASSGDNTHAKVTASVSKTSRKPIMLTKTVASSEVSSHTAVGKDLCDVARTPNAAGESNLPKDNQQMTDNTAIGKIFEDNILRKQIALAVQNCNRFQLKVTKSTDDNKVKRNDKTADFMGIGQPKRQLTKFGHIVGQNPNSESVMVTSMEKVDKLQNYKSDETQNVLLKHLLQSSISQRSNTGCNQNLAPRKLATVRAPSLGVVSSLEAQLARPVIPPSVGEMKPELKLSNKLGNDKLKKNPLDRDGINVKSRPEMISRETSFVSTFPSKQKTTGLPSEFDRMSTMQTNSNQTTDTDASKAVSFQTSTNSNYNSINLFKFFKQKEQTKGNGRPNESNTNQTQSKLLSPEESTDTKMTIKTEYENIAHDQTSSSPTVKTKLVKMDIEQNIELRKRFKRDYQKQKRQMLLNKEPQNHQKKKSRKLSKANEDFDEFIENKVVQMKQMFVLEVLEPLLSTFLGICSIYGYNDKVRNHVEYAYHNVFKEDFGKTNLKNLVDFYSVKPYGPCYSSKANNVPSFQNKFYDEEFSTMNHESCDKLFQFISTLKQQNHQSTENISLISSSPCNESKSQSLLNISYPGIKFEKNINLNTDRMSPIVPLINSNHFGIIKRKKPTTHKSRNKCAYGNIETTVILTLSSFVAENVLDILRDLENLLNIYSPVSYKLHNNVRNGLYISRIRNLQKTESTNIQNFLNGTYKCCRKCHLTVICGIVGAESNSNIKKRIMADSHFCDKFCCIQYKKKGRKYVVTRKRERYYQNNQNNQINQNNQNNQNNNNKSISQISTNENSFSPNTSNYKVVSPNSFWKPSHKGLSNEDVNEICLKMRIAISLNTSKDTRRCILCNQKGDSFAEGSSRLLNYDVNKWVHLNCALWSNSVYETINGGLMNLELTMQQGLHQKCSFCNQYGASIKCFKMRCGHIYHLPCAIKEQCVFYKNKTIHCASHAHRMEKKNELNSIRVRRRVYIERDENRQVAAVMHHLELSNLLRIGNLTFINVGQLLPHQLEAFHTPNYIYPIGYKIIRFYWSMKKLNKRCRYICSIAETNGRPEFVIQIQEPFENDVELRDISPKAVWQRVLDKIVMLRKGQALVQLFTEFITGEDLFGLAEPSIVRILESLPGVESLTDYRFKYGRNPLLELPLALNPSGSARTEPKQRHIINWKKAHTQRTSSINLKLTLSPSSLVAGEVACPYSKQFVHSKSSQYRKMKQEWRNNVYLARSKIQGLGLYAARDLEKHTMVIEYIGQVIRTEVSELREKQYDLRNRGIYMFRLDEERVVDATLSGGLARYINHSCNPNCVTEIVDVDREYRIIIFAKRRINKGEELSYDYKFDIEDDAHKISCMCDAPNCRKWMN